LAGTIGTQCTKEVMRSRKSVKDGQKIKDKIYTIYWQRKNTKDNRKTTKYGGKLRCSVTLCTDCAGQNGMLNSLVSSNFFLFRPSWSLSYHVVVEFTSCAISAYYHYVVSSNPTHCEVYSIQYYVIKFVSDLRQVIHPFSIT
jgi:hypothetical protein